MTIKTNKARKHKSDIVKSLLDEISPIEMQQTKNRMLLAANIEEMMIDKGWNKTEFAKQVNKYPSEITRWFSGTHTFTTDTLTEISVVFDVNIAQLFEKRKPLVLYKGYFAYASRKPTQIKPLFMFGNQIPYIKENYESNTTLINNDNPYMPITAKIYA